MSEPKLKIIASYPNRDITIYFCGARYELSRAYSDNWLLCPPRGDNIRIGTRRIEWRTALDRALSIILERVREKNHD